MSKSKQFRNRRIRQIEELCRKFNVGFQIQTASTGTRYFTLEDGTTVRVSDHADAYATADYTCDPAEDEYKAVKKHIQSIGGKMELNEFNIQRLADRFHDQRKVELAHAVHALLDPEAAKDHIRLVWGSATEQADREIAELEKNMRVVRRYFK